ncbi:Hypothetical predicted protein [Lynx pardinus]|uniref:Uncharacterized protein n=1 Tax=Lynx pardinus TaxID=191816 RepID=A0A485MPG0_LYNPA|nr:Hypothetical predicted protein [Lynx pardinus]
MPHFASWKVSQVSKSWTPYDNVRVPHERKEEDLRAHQPLPDGQTRPRGEGVQIAKDTADDEATREGPPLGKTEPRKDAKGKAGPGLPTRSLCILQTPFGFIRWGPGAGASHARGPLCYLGGNTEHSVPGGTAKDGLCSGQGTATLFPFDHRLCFCRVGLLLSPAKHSPEPQTLATAVRVAGVTESQESAATPQSECHVLYEIRTTARAHDPPPLRGGGADLGRFGAHSTQEAPSDVTEQRSQRVNAGTPAQQPRKEQFGPKCQQRRDRRWQL